MAHPNEEQLVLYYYGDADDGVAIETHLAECAECRASLDALKQTFLAVEALPVPERGPGYGRNVWAQLEPKLQRARGGSWLEWFQPKRLALAGGMAALLLVAFLAGRFIPRGSNGNGAPEPTAEAVRERVLLVAVGDHLERSQMVLVELVNTKPNGTVNIAAERNRAENLVAANRLYRQTAVEVGDATMNSLLEDLERVLLEIARSPEKVTGPELAALQKRIEAKGILFKVRVVGSKVREREQAPMPGPQRGWS